MGYVTVENYYPWHIISMWPYLICHRGGHPLAWRSRGGWRWCGTGWTGNIRNTRRESPDKQSNGMCELSLNPFVVYHLVGLNFPLLQATNKADILELWNHETLSSSSFIFLSTDLTLISGAWTTFRYLSGNHSSEEQSSPDYPCCFNNSITFKTSFACLKSRHYVVLSNIIN